MSKPEAKWIPGALRAGTVVGAWRVVEARDRGAYGTVYLTERVGQEGAGPFALKMALGPHDPRFEREVELLSRVRHPSIPRLHDHGEWTLRSGVDFPFIVMDFVKGVPLYTWAAESKPSSRQMMRVLVQVAGALEATHREGCVHRDIKGDNVLVNAEGRAFLMDFGAGDFPGSRPLTQELLPPGTPEYRSPEALRFQWEYHEQGGARYKPGRSDDVYALGVTAYRMVTGSYPPPGFDTASAVAPQQARPQRLLRPRELVTVCAELDAVIVRMLSDVPEVRGSAGEIKRTFEQAANSAGHKADVPVLLRPRKATAKRVVRPALSGYGRWLVAAGFAITAVALLLTPSTRRGTHPSEESLKVVQAIRGSGGADAGVSALGDFAAPAFAATGTGVVPSRGLGLDMPKKPLPGQKLPPCIESFEVEIELTEGQKDTRSCWIKIDVRAAACKAYGYEYRGGCYVPSSVPPKLPQSEKP